MMKIDNLPEIPNTYLVALLFLGLIILRMWNIDSFTTAGLSLVMGYITGKHVEQARCTKNPPLVS